MLEGYKTYICSILAAAVTIAYALGWITQEVWMVLMGILIPGGVATLRAGVDKK